MSNVNLKQRIVLLDGFRSVAILFVMLFHYTYRWTNSSYTPLKLYPYNDWYGDTFEYGYQGVSFFFIISGFVISFTLESTKSIGSFFKNRLIRLFPPLLLCTFITFGVVSWLDPERLIPEWHERRNFLPSLTLISPGIYEQLFKKDFDWLNSSYWSLWKEIQFYFIAAIVYFSSRSRYFTNMLLISLVMVIAGKLLKNSADDSSILHLSLPGAGKNAFSFWLNGPLNLTTQIAFFAVGIVFHRLYKESTLRSRTDQVLSLLVFLSAFVYVRDTAEFLFTIGMLILFGLLVYRPNWLSSLNNRFFIKVGVWSYTIYLIHEPAGILLIHRYGHYLGAASPLAPLMVMAMSVLFAAVSFYTYERYSHRLLKKILFKPAR